MKHVFGLVLLLTVKISIKTDKKENEFSLNFHQTDYHLKFERMVLERYNKNYVEHMSVVTFKYNRTQAVTNFTFSFKADIGNDMVWIIQGYKFMSNEYRLFPLHFGANACKALAANVAGADRLLTCGNFTGCPYIVGRTYHICNWSPDQTKFPPFIPNGEFKVELQALHFSTEMFVWNLYGTITRPISVLN